MRRTVLAILVLSLVMGCASAESASDSPTLETEDQKTLYALGFVMARQFGGVEFDEAEIELILMGLSDAARGDD